MKWKILTVAFFFSLACNVAALVAFLLSRAEAGCPVHGLARAEGEALGLTPAQREQFDWLDQIYHQERRAAAGRLRALRGELLGLVFSEGQTVSGVEDLLSRACEEQSALQRRLIENLRAKVVLLDAEQRNVYRKMVENLAGGCGCVGCTGTCQ